MIFAYELIYFKQEINFNLKQELIGFVVVVTYYDVGRPKIACKLIFAFFKFFLCYVHFAYRV